MQANPITPTLITNALPLSINLQIVLNVTSLSFKITMKSPIYRPSTKYMQKPYTQREDEKLITKFDKTEETLFQ